MEMEYKYFKIKLHNLNDSQKQIINEYIGYSRYCYNWALEYWNKNHEAGNKDPSVFSIQLEFTQFRNKEENSWLKKYDVETARASFRHLKRGFSMFFDHTTKGRPKFHTKKHSKKSYAVRSDRIKFSKDNRYMTISGFGPKNRLTLDCYNHRIPVGKNIKYYSPTISYDGINYWFSVAVGIYNPIIIHAVEDPIGIDVGIRSTAVLSDGTVYDPPNQHRVNTLYNRIKKLQSAINRDIDRRKDLAAHTRTKYEEIPKSNNQVKRETRFKQTWKDITNLYNTHYHNVSRDIANKRSEYIVIETLDIRDIHKKSHNGSYPPYISLGKLLEYISYKAKQNGSKIIKAPFGYKSSQICSNCGAQYEIKASKIYRCKCCGIEINRDYNASLNLLNYGKSVYNL